MKNNMVEFICYGVFEDSNGFTPAIIIMLPGEAEKKFQANFAFDTSEKARDFLNEFMSALRDPRADVWIKQ